MDVENVTLDFKTDLIQITSIEYFQSLIILLTSVSKTQISK